MFTLLAMLLLVHAAAAPATVGLERIKSEYPAIFTVRFFKPEDKTYAAAVVEPPPEGHFLREFVDENRHLLQYLLSSGTSVNVQELLDEQGDQEKARREFNVRLRDDVGFNALILPMIDRWLRERGTDLAGYDPPQRKEVTLRRLLDVAARFYYPDKIEEDGTIGAHICAGMNGLADLSGDKEVAVEAFAFQVVFGEMFQKKYDLDEEFGSELKSVGGLDLSSDPNTRLTRVRGAVWAHMARSKRLERALSREYRRRAAYLPFTLVTAAVVKAGR